MQPPHECGGFFEDFFRYRVHLLVETSSFYDSKIIILPYLFFFSLLISSILVFSFFSP